MMSPASDRCEVVDFGLVPSGLNTFPTFLPPPPFPLLRAVLRCCRLGAAVASVWIGRGGGGERVLLLLLAK